MGEWGKKKGNGREGTKVKMQCQVILCCWMMRSHVGDFRALICCLSSTEDSLNTCLSIKRVLEEAVHMLDLEG